MRELFEFRINNDFAHMLFDSKEGKELGEIQKTVRVVEITKDDARFNRIPIVDTEVKRKFNRPFIYSWRIMRKYTKQELDYANILSVKINRIFEPAGELCGTIYNEEVACNLCGANRSQVTPLMLRKRSIPNKDIARTIAGEIVVSRKTHECFQKYKLTGIEFDPVMERDVLLDFFQPRIIAPELILSEDTVTGINPFNFYEMAHGEIYTCPLGHTLGLNLLSEIHIASDDIIGKYDFYSTRQKIGVKRGFLRPQPVYLCSQKFRQMVINEKLSGFSFEVACISHSLPPETNTEVSSVR